VRALHSQAGAGAGGKAAGGAGVLFVLRLGQLRLGQPVAG
jgi:hypothetical protein